MASVDVVKEDLNYGIRKIFESDSLIIEAVSHDSVSKLDKDRYNSNNHWGDQGQPKNYDEVLALGETHRWVHKFRTQYHTIDLDASSLRWLLRAEKSGHLYGRFPEAFAEERDDLLEKYAASTAHLFTEDACGRGWFVRTESVSLKYGYHGTGPYRDLRSIIESLATSSSGHSPLKSGIVTPDSDAGLRIYLFPWVDINQWKEFRVFVHDHRIRCISQQSLYRVNELLQSLPDDDTRIKTIIGWVDKVREYHHDVIIPALDYMPSSTEDIALVEHKDSEDTVLFIEPNSFGAEFASGSSLFHWVHDRHLLYNAPADQVGDQKIVFRFVEPAPTADRG